MVEPVLISSTRYQSWTTIISQSPNGILHILYVSPFYPVRSCLCLVFTLVLYADTDRPERVWDALSYPKNPSANRDHATTRTCHDIPKTEKQPQHFWAQRWRSGLCGEPFPDEEWRLSPAVVFHVPNADNKGTKSLSWRGLCNAEPEHIAW